MSDMVLGVFAQQDQAESAITELKNNGYKAKDISIIVKDQTQSQTVVNNTGVSAANNTVAGATTGGLIGAIAGLLVGVGAITLPGIGALLIAGPIATALGLTGAAATTVSGAVTGVLAGGLIGALTSLGVSAADARAYQQSIEAGAILLAVPIYEAHDEEVRDILTSNGADQIRTVHFPDERRYAFGA